MKRFEIEFEDESPQAAISYELTGEETLRLESTDDGTFLYANQQGFHVLAQLCAKLSLGNYTPGFHVHLKEDFGDEPAADIVTITVHDS